MPKDVHQQLKDFRESFLPESDFDALLDIGTVGGMREERHPDIYDRINTIMEEANALTEKSKG